MSNTFINFQRGSPVPPDTRNLLHAKSNPSVVGTSNFNNARGRQYNCPTGNTWTD